MVFHEVPTVATASIVFRKCVYAWERCKVHMLNQEPQMHLKICVLF